MEHQNALGGLGSRGMQAGSFRSLSSRLGLPSYGLTWPMGVARSEWPSSLQVGKWGFGRGGGGGGGSWELGVGSWELGVGSWELIKVVWGGELEFWLKPLLTQPASGNCSGFSWVARGSSVSNYLLHKKLASPREGPLCAGSGDHKSSPTHEAT